MLLVLNVIYHHRIAAHVARDLHRHRSWASVWLKRYDKGCIEGLKDRTKTGRPTKLSEEKITYKIKTTLKESNQGWTTKQVEELIKENSGIRNHYTHIYRILRKQGFRQKVLRKVHVNTVFQEEKSNFKKSRPNTCGYQTPKKGKDLP